MCAGGGLKQLILVSVGGLGGCRQADWEREITYVNLCDGYINNTTHYNKGIKRVPCINKIMLDGKQQNNKKKWKRTEKERGENKEENSYTWTIKLTEDMRKKNHKIKWRVWGKSKTKSENPMMTRDLSCSTAAVKHPSKPPWKKRPGVLC